MTDKDKYEAACKELKAFYAPAMDDEIPTEIKEAARKLQLWFAARGITKWELMGIGSTNSYSQGYRDGLRKARECFDETLADLKF